MKRALPLVASLILAGAVAVSAQTAPSGGGQGQNRPPLTPEQQAAWQAAMRPVWDEFGDRIGRDLVDAALAAAQ